MRAYLAVVGLIGCAAPIEPNGAGFVEGTATGEGGLELPFAVWFPADVSEATLTAEYALGASGDARLDAVPATGPFPLILASHGNGGFRHAGAGIYERLAAEGYVVAAMDHVGNTFEDRITQRSFIEVFIRRPSDVAATWAAVAELVETEDHPLEGLVDVERIAVMGHSTGGSTALLVSGGGMDRATLLLACAGGQLSGTACELADAAEGDSVTLIPEGMPAPSAAVLLAPLNGGLFGDELDVSGPTLVAVGDRDSTTPLARDAEPIYEALPDPRALAVLHGGTHFGFATICSVPGLELVLDDVAADCVDPELMGEPEVIDVSVDLSVGWLDAHLRGDAAGTERAAAAGAEGRVTWQASLGPTR